MRRSLYLSALLIVALLVISCRRLPRPSDEPPQPAVSGAGQVSVEEARVLVRESFPMQLALLIRGTLATPCHELEWEVAEPDGEGRIFVEVYAQSEKGNACIQVIEPFEETLELGSFTEGEFTVWLNGTLVGEVDF